MTLPNSGRAETAGSVEGDDGEVVAHVAGTPATVRLVAKTELAPDVVSPAFYAVIGEDDTGVLIAEAEGRNGFSGPYIDGHQVVAHFIWAVSDRIRRIPSTQLPAEVVTPAFQRCIIEESASVIPVGHDLHGGFSSSQIDGRQVVSHVGQAGTT